ncbi:ribosomal-protein-alanine N-acetyltransferase [Anaerocolumna jejuensis DSM 15929]|uniref:Ribosomal-protein-alanine N-acetyltransferase n=1 Tax=Anaerocolumna jejuensis DSM 15929 TaxID=1121322 RepID=A0A1M6LY40_9FIRM|nr:GNAT family protein [Anaerocolumna jejuensis]SHJ76109.1 ribosomal-protein-alanine N-acetyltransferase [Anaerocolumna jejuensis DSM 15929]
MKYDDYFAAIPHLETDRLILRAFYREDINTYLEIIHDPQVQQFLGGGVNLFNEEPHISNWLNNINGRLLKSKTVFTWCVEYRSEKKVIGRIDLGGFVKKTMAEISYYFSPEYGGMGLATEAVKEVTQFGFDDLKLHRIQAAVMPDNVPSLKVLKKAGFVEEGILKKYLFGKEFHDTVMLAAIREENLNK